MRTALAAGVALALTLPVPLVHAEAAPGDTGGRLVEADAIRTTDHARFTRMLGELHADEARLGAGDKWYLRFLDGWEANYEGRYADAEAILRDVMNGADRDALVTRATAMLMNNLSEQGKYAEAYAVATRSVEMLPSVSDPYARFVMLANLSQMLTFAGKPDLGLKYAEMMLAATPAGQSPCQGMVQKVTALEGSRALTSHSRELLDTIERCTTDRQPVFANTMSLILVDRLFEERKFDEALAEIERITPAILATQYFPHIMSLASQRAQIYEQMGDLSAAHAAALETIGMSHGGDINEALRFAYRILYSIEKARGHAAVALDYYEHYVVQDQGYLRDANVRNAAYEAAQQHFFDEKLQTEGLSKENRILRLQQALDSKAVETSRLYVVMLSLVLLSIIFWMVRIKRSQLRFKWLSSCDGLTGIFHHQFFMSEAARQLRILEKRSGEGCLVFVDLDHFKQVNDTYGHAVGDAVLKHAVALCKGQLRQPDLLGRLGGEEFGILLMDTPRLQGKVVAERLREALAGTPLVIEDVTVAFSASIGVACTDRLGHDLQALCRAADAALYRAKHKGRDRVEIDDGTIGSIDTSLTARPMPATSAGPRP